MSLCTTWNNWLANSNGTKAKAGRIFHCLPCIKHYLTCCHLIPKCGRLVDVDILELSEFPWPGVGTCHTSMGLGLWMVKNLWAKPDNGNVWEAFNLMSNVSPVRISFRPKVDFSRSMAVCCPLGHSTKHNIYPLIVHHQSIKISWKKVLVSVFVQ